jgi:hypothetical protein
VKSAQQAFARYQAGTSGASDTWSQAIQDTQVDVMGRAVAAKGVAAQNYQRVMSDGSYEKAVQASGGTQNWKTQTEAKKANYAVGVAAGATKFESAIAKILAAEQRIVSGLPARVPGNPQANLARVQGVVMGLHSLKGQLKG